MDSYLASGEYKDTEHLYFNLNFEVLSGCQFNCKGCHVNKQEAGFQGQETEGLRKLLTEIENQSVYKCFIAFIGPTDFLTADNTIELLEDPVFRDLLHPFKRLSFQTTALNLKKAPEFARVLKQYYPDKELEINILVEPEKVLNEKYLKTLRENRDEIYRILNWATPIRTFGIMNLYDYSHAKREEVARLLKDYDYIHHFTEGLFETTVDFNFSFGRKPDVTREEFIQATEQIKSLFNDSITEDTVTFLRFSFGKLLDSLVERQYNYINGRLYQSPLLYERYVSFHPLLGLEMKDWTLQELENAEDHLAINQYTYSVQTEDCGSCPYLKTCVDRQILHLMEIHDIKHCLVAREALDQINGTPNLTPKQKRKYFSIQPV